VGRLGSGPTVVGRLGSRVCVSVSFKIFALAAEENVVGPIYVGPEIARLRLCGGMSGGNMSEGEMSYTQIYIDNA